MTLIAAIPPSIVFIPRTAVPSVNVIVPDASGVTVAVNTTVLPYVEGSEEETSETAELATESVSVMEVLDAATLELPR
jgi:hypothetical protein